MSATTSAACAPLLVMDYVVAGYVPRVGTMLQSAGARLIWRMCAPGLGAVALRASKRDFGCGMETMDDGLNA